MKLNHAASCLNIKFNFLISYANIEIKDKQDVKRKPYAIFDFPGPCITNRMDKMRSLLNVF